MSVFGGDSWAREVQHRKRRVDDLLLPSSSSFKKLSNGKYACLVCPHNPILDSPLMLSMQNKGSRHSCSVAELRREPSSLIDFKEGRHASFEYGRYGNPTTKALEEKMSALEKAESTLFVSSGMKTRIFIQNELPKMGISAIVIDPADMDSLKSALEENNVSLFFTESPTNSFLRCVDIEFVSKLCHSKGTLVCIDGTSASPVNQKALTSGADIVVHSATKFIAGHNDVLGGCLSGSVELISKIR